MDLSDVFGVDRVVDYQRPEADKSVVFKHGQVAPEFRTYYLQHLRDEWEWVRQSEKGNGYVLLARRS